MLFNSFEFVLFLPLVFALYWFVFQRSLRAQNFLVLVASYVFYGYWDWRFLLLIVVSTTADYFIGLSLERTEDPRRRALLLSTSLAINLGLLGFFKYYNFFVDSAVVALGGLGFSASPRTLQVILPVGISFYTFQTLSYTIDIYRRQLKPTRDWIAFFAFVSFFPQLVAGPIERAKNLLPQFHEKRRFDFEHAKDGLRQILWGLFKKVVVADTCARNVDHIFGHSDELGGSTLLLGAMFFAFQIYGDFSGYSDIAIGTARLFGFDLMRNFAFPYFSRDIGEFWRRWHISLSSWFRDYVYIPLGGSRASKGRQVFNSLVTFTVSGFWHGANWTFVAWGALNGLYYVPAIVTGKPKMKGTVAEGRWFPTALELAQLASTFLLTNLAWVFFRADDMGHALSYLAGIASPTLFSEPFSGAGRSPGLSLAIVGVLVGVEWMQRTKQHALEVDALPLPFRWSGYILLMLAIITFFGADISFIYFQF
jgi:alginate O-acetyltransferase complex protein AlgI